MVETIKNREEAVYCVDRQKNDGLSLWYLVGIRKNRIGTLVCIIVQHLRVGEVERASMTTYLGVL